MFTELTLEAKGIAENPLRRVFQKSRRETWMVEVGILRSDKLKIIWIEQKENEGYKGNLLASQHKSIVKVRCY